MAETEEEALTCGICRKTGTFTAPVSVILVFAPAMPKPYPLIPAEDYRVCGACDAIFTLINRADVEPLRVPHAQPIQLLVVQVAHLLARDADQVVVRLSRAGAGQRRLVARLLVQGIHVGDGADALEGLEVLVDGGERERGKAPLHRAVDLLGAGGLSRGGQRLEDRQPLVRDGEAVGAAELGELLHFALHVRSCAMERRAASGISVRYE